MTKSPHPKRGLSRKEFELFWDDVIEKWWPILNEWRCPWKREIYKAEWNKDNVRGAIEFMNAFAAALRRRKTK